MAGAAGLLLARLALAVVFFLAGAAKLSDRAGSRATMVDFGLPPSLAAVFSLALPVLELFVAIALLPAATSASAALGALILLGAFSLGIVNLLVRGHHADCRCFGQLRSSPVGWSTLARNVALGFIAVFVLIGQRNGMSPSYLVWLGSLNTMGRIALFATVFGLVLLGSGAWFALHLMRQHGRILLRLDALEAELAERGIISAPTGLPVGAQAPAFEAPNLRGGSTSLNELVIPGLPVVLLFHSARCAACTALLPDVARWQAELGATLTVALISQGTLEENRGALAEASIRHVLVQRGREIAEAFGAYITPSALLISREGTVASPLAEGAIAVRRLVESIVPVPLTKQNHLPGASPMVSFDAG